MLPLPDAFLRRCLYFNIGFPKGEALREIAQQRLENLQEEESDLVGKIIAEFEQVRLAMSQPGSRPPGTSEFLELLAALRRRQNGGADVEKLLTELPNQLPLLGILLKTEADQELYIKKAAMRQQKAGGKG